MHACGGCSGVVYNTRAHTACMHAWSAAVCMRAGPVEVQGLVLCMCCRLAAYTTFLLLLQIGATALLWAARNGKADTLKLLLERSGAEDVNHTDEVSRQACCSRQAGGQEGC